MSSGGEREISDHEDADGDRSGGNGLYWVSEHLASPYSSTDAEEWQANGLEAEHDGEKIGGSVV